jgi:hypothetical protein
VQCFQVVKTTGVIPSIGLAFLYRVIGEVNIDGPASGAHRSGVGGLSCNMKKISANRVRVNIRLYKKHPTVTKDRNKIQSTTKILLKHKTWIGRMSNADRLSSGHGLPMSDRLVDIGPVEQQAPSTLLFQTEPSLPWSVDP